MYNSGYTGGLHEIKKHTTQGTKKNTTEIRPQSM